MNKRNKKRPNNTPLTLEEIYSYSETMPNGCIEWRRGKNDKYPRIGIGNKRYTISRIVAQLVHGEPAAGMVAMHSCDNPPCVNPDHLRWGTKAENTQDALAKNRQYIATGSAHGLSKLKETDIPIIFEMRDQGMYYREIGAYFGVTAENIYAIFKGKTWTKVVQEYKQAKGI